MIDFVVVAVAAGAVFAMLALGFSVIYRPTHQLHVAYGVVALSGPYAAIWLTRAGVTTWLAVPAGLVAAAGLGALIERWLYRGTGGDRLGVLLTSFGFVYIGEAALQWIFGPGAARPEGFDAARQTVSLGPVSMPWVHLIAVFAAVVVAAGAAAVFRRSDIGYVLRAMAMDEDMAVTSGVPVRALKLGCYAVGSAVAALAVTFRAIDVGIGPSGGVSLVLTAFVGTVILGRSIPLASLGGFAVGFLSSMSTYFVSGRYQTMTVYGALILLLLLRVPRGRRPVPTFEGGPDKGSASGPGALRAEPQETSR